MFASLRPIAALAALAVAPTLGLAQQGAPRPDVRAFLAWRSIGPHRGSRVKAAVGVSSRPGI